MNRFRYQKLFSVLAVSAVFCFVRLYVPVGDASFLAGTSLKSHISAIHASAPAASAFFKKSPPVIQFSQNHHKRALVKNVYIHEPVFIAVQFFYREAIYRKFCQELITGRHEFQSSLRGPPAVG